MSKDDLLNDLERNLIFLFDVALERIHFPDLKRGIHTKSCERIYFNGCNRIYHTSLERYFRLSGYCSNSICEIHGGVERW